MKKLFLLVSAVLLVSLILGCSSIGGSPAPDTTPPTISSVIPENGALHVNSLTVVISVTFSKAMDESSTQTAFSMVDASANKVTGSFAWSGNTMTFTPINPSPLAYDDTVYTCTVGTGAKDSDGNYMSAAYQWSFTTLYSSSTTTPSVVSPTTPADSAKDVAILPTILVNFNEAMDESSAQGAFLINGATPTGTFSWNGNTMIFSLNTSDSLASNTTYTCTVGTGAQDLNGNALTAAYQWSFSTGSNSDIAPTVIPALDVPADNATAVSVLPAISVTFSEAMDETSAQGAFLINGATPTGTFSWNGNTMTFTPTASLDKGMTYTCTVGNGAKDSDGNYMSAAYQWSFTTLLPAPTIVTGSESPLDGAANVAVSSKISVTFSEPMDTSSLAASMNPTVDGTFAWSGGNTIITFTPTYNLANNTMYTCTVTTAKNTQGTPLAGTYTWSFTTVAAP